MTASGEKKIEPIVTYGVIVGPLGQGFTGLVIEAINPRSVVGKIVNTT